MLGDMNVHAVLPVTNLEEARQFYEGTLGLEELGRNDEAQTIMYRSGDTHVLVYVSEYAGTNEATAATWETNDVVAAAEILKNKGVVFEHYNIPGATLEGDVYRMGPMTTAWFKDPFGNVLNIANEQ
jgi:catechol 2,3-dioxygenase-like lactoylglutathione lyase family enzyme